MVEAMRRSSEFTRVHPTDETHGVTELELFFDLVFVFAFTQVTQLMATDPTAQGAVRGLVLLALLWWAWCSYSWLGNQARADRGLVAITVTIAMIAMFLVALAIPDSFIDRPGDWSAPFVLVAGYTVVRLVHTSCYCIAAGSDVALRRQVLLSGIPLLPATALLVVGAGVGAPFQTALWALALIVDYAGVALSGTSGWLLPSASHFAERYGLIVIVALGESVVAIGVGVSQLAISPAVGAGAATGVLCACCMWWLYFRNLAPRVARQLVAVTGTARGRLGRDVYTYLHFPVVAAIIFIALGMKKVLEYVADTRVHAFGDALTGVPLIALFGGIATYLFALAGVERRVAGTWSVPRITTGAFLLALIPVAWMTPALFALVMATIVLITLVSFEMSRTVSEELADPV